MSIPLRRRARAAALRGLVRSTGWLPPGVLDAALRPAAKVAFWKRYQAVLEHNLSATIDGIRALDPAAADRLGDTRGFGQEVARYASEQAAHWVRLARGTEGRRGAWLENQVQLGPGLEHLDQVLAEGRGAIVVTAHIGNWELLCARLRRRGHAGAVVGRVRRGDPSHGWLMEMRDAYGVQTIPQDAHPRAALDVLRGGGILGLLTDLRVRQLDGRMVPFFGTPALTMTAPAAFARVHRAPIVPVRCVRLPGDRLHTLDASEPLHLREDLGREDALMDLLARQNRLFEEWILETPEQWAWHQRRW